jgi:hypothetical protein
MDQIWDFVILIAAVTTTCILRNQRQHCDYTNHSETCAEQKYGGMSDLVPKPTSD